MTDDEENQLLTIDDFNWFTGSGVALKCSFDLDTREDDMVSIDIKLVPSRLSSDGIAFEISITEFKAENDYEADEILKYYRRNLSLSYLNQCLLTKYKKYTDITLEQFLSKIGVL